jgi:protein SCO1/2
MRAFLAALALLSTFFVASPVAAALTEAELLDVGLHPVEGAAAPPDIAFTDDDGHAVALGDVTRGRATLLILADYNCHTICGPILGVAATAIRDSGLVAGRDFNLVVVGIDPRATLADAARMKAEQFGDDPALALDHFLYGDARAIERLSAAIGYHAHYDAEMRQFAHPTDMLVLTPERRISRLLPGLAISGEDLRFALVEAGGGGVASLIDRAHVLCYGLDPARGVYNSAVRATLIGAGAATLAGIAAIAAIAQRRRRRLLVGER